MFKRLVLPALLLVMIASEAAEGFDQDPLAEFLFPPEVVMQHQRAIGLTEEQKTYIKSEIQKATSRFTELQWDIQQEMENLHSLLKQASVDEQRAIGHLDRLLEIEREVKRVHLTLAIRIKNKLSPEQQAQLQALKKQSYKR